MARPAHRMPPTHHESSARGAGEGQSSPSPAPAGERSPRQVLGELWSIRADNARAELTCAEFLAAAAKWQRAAVCFRRAQAELARAELECIRLGEAAILAAVERGGEG